MKNENTKLQEIKKLVKRGMSLALATALVVGAVTLSSCNNENIPDNGGDETSHIDKILISHGFTIHPDIPLNDEQKEIVDNTYEFLETINHDLQGVKISAIECRTLQFNDKVQPCFRIAPEGKDLTDSDNPIFPADPETRAKMAEYVSITREEIPNVTIKNASMLNGTFRVEFDTENYNENYVNQLLLLINGSTHGKTHLKDKDTITSSEKKKFFQILNEERPYFGNEISRIQLHINNDIQRMSIRIHPAEPTDNTYDYVYLHETIDNCKSLLDYLELDYGFFQIRETSDSKTYMLYGDQAPDALMNQLLKDLLTILENGAIISTN